MELNKDNFRSTYEENNLVFVVFRADWCGPCQSFKPIYEKVASQFPEVVFGTVDVDSQPEISEYFSIRSVPFMVIVREGVELYAEPGSMGEEQLVDLIKRSKAIDIEAEKKKIPVDESKE